MNKKILNNLINQGFSTHKIANNLSMSQTNVVYWLKKFKLSTKKNTDEKKCPRCKNTKKITEFYDRRNKPGSSAYCKKCTNKQTTERHTAAKQKAVEYKGGKCVKCGYDKYIGALDFHHLNPDNKEFSLGTLKFISLNDKVKKELDKCILVCSNCHREIHGGIT
jgi:predicted transcriptional regulator